MVDIVRASDGKTPTDKAGMRTFAEVISGSLPATILRRGRERG